MNWFFSDPISFNSAVPRTPLPDGAKVRLLGVAILLALLAACGSPQKAGPGYYRVERGDTLSQIARKHGQTVNELARWNKISNPNEIEVGQLLRVAPEGGASIASGPASPMSTPSTVKPPIYAQVPDNATSKKISLIWPAEGKLARGFNVAGSKGLLITNRAGTPVVAAAAGTVAYAGSALRGYGNLVILKHGNGFMTVYAHNSKILVEEGQSIRTGQRIAEMGDTDSSEVGLYFELRHDGDATNPMRSLPPR